MEVYGRPELSLLELILSNSPDLKLQSSSPDLAGYLSHLTSLPLPDILKEPSRLSSEASQLTDSLTTLCQDESSTFLQMRETFTTLPTVLNSFSEEITALQENFPLLEERARKFGKEAKVIHASRLKSASVLEQHDKLMDILEIPQLIDTCARNGYYQEAMDLSAHFSTLMARFHDIPHIQSVAAEVDHAMRSMLAQLLSTLREPAKLPALFKAVGFLRKLGAAEELELALTFLVGRLGNFSSSIRVIEKERTDHARYVRRYVDAWREGVYDLVTQYSTIFLDRCPSEDLARDLRYLLSPLTHYVLEALRQVLAANLPHVEDATTLNSLLTQLTYCASSCARIGLDFRALLPPLFEDAVNSNFARAVESATQKFTTSLGDVSKYKLPSQYLITSSSAHSPPRATEATLSPQVHITPTIIASYPPLAIFTNGILTALNTLRLLAPISLLHHLTEKLDGSLLSACTPLFNHLQSKVAAQRTAKAAKSHQRSASHDDDDEEEEEEEGPPPIDEEKVLMGASSVAAFAVVPFLMRALVEGVYSESLRGFEMSPALKGVLGQLAELSRDPKDAESGGS